MSAEGEAIRSNDYRKDTTVKAPSTRPAVVLGLDVGKSSHWACLVDRGGEVLASAPVRNREAELDALFASAPAGTLVEVYATTLHYTPCMVDDGGFQVMVALPAGTNGPRPEAAADMPAAGDSYCYWKADKWVLCHADSPKAAEGGYVGLIGKNLDITCD